MHATRFSRKNRLARKNDFQFVFAKPCKLTHQYLRVLYRPNTLAYSRLGVMISKKEVKLAVTRNYIRRVIRESFRHHLEHVKGLDIVIMVRSKYARDKKDLRDDIDHLWQRLATSSNSI